MSRWVRIQADILDHPLFADSERSESDAWLWLITHAAWSETQHRVRSDLVNVEAGSLFVTLRQLQNEWRWKSDKRVRTFLKTLEKLEMIEIKTDAGKTQITICNYMEYQGHGRTADAGKTQSGRTKDTNTPVITSSLRSEVKARAPEKSSVQSELMKVLDEDHAKAVIDHRKALKKPLTVRAAQLLAKQFSQCPDPNAAADAMIENCWQGFKPEWLLNKQQPRQRAGQPTRISHTDIWADALREDGVFTNEPVSHQSDILDAGYGNRHQESNVHPLRIAGTGRY